MRKWYEEWGVWLISVLSLIGLGVVLGKDISEFQGVASALTALGTCMLGAAALLAIPQWKNQEKRRFQATIAADMHAAIAISRWRLDALIYWYKHAINDMDEKALNDTDVGREIITNSRDKLVTELEPLLKVLSDNVIPKAIMLGKSFSDEALAFSQNVMNLIASPNLRVDELGQLDKLLMEFDDVLNYLKRVALLDD